MWCITCGARRVCGSCLAKLVSNGACLCQRRVRSQRHVRGTCGHWTSSSIATTRAKPFKICNVIDEFTREHVGFEVARSITATAAIDLLENVSCCAWQASGVCVWITARSSSAVSWLVGQASKTLSRRSSHRECHGITGLWSPSTTGYATSCERTRYSTTPTMRRVACDCGRSAIIPIILIRA